MLLANQIITIVKGAILYGAVSDVSALHAILGGVYHIIKAVLFGFRKEYVGLVYQISNIWAISDEVLGLISFLSWARYISHYLLLNQIICAIMLVFKDWCKEC